MTLAEQAEQMPYDPTEAMRHAAKEIDPALPMYTISALWRAMWSAALREREGAQQAGQVEKTCDSCKHKGKHSMSWPCTACGTPSGTAYDRWEPEAPAEQAGQVPVAWRAKDANGRWMYGDLPAPELPGGPPELMALAAAPEAPAEAPAQPASTEDRKVYKAIADRYFRDTQPEQGEREAGDVVAFELYNPKTGHAIVDYSRQTHVGHLTDEAGYEARPLVYAAPRQAVLDGSKPIPAWQAREALDELEAAARGDSPFNHQAAAVIRAALEARAASAQPEQGERILAYLDDIKDDAAAHIWPDDLQKCQTSECVAKVYSVRMGSPDGKTVPLFSREQVAEAIARAASAQAKKPVGDYELRGLHALRKHLGEQT